MKTKIRAHMSFLLPLLFPLLAHFPFPKPPAAESPAAESPAAESPAAAHAPLQAGHWRVVLQRPDSQQIVFNFLSTRRGDRDVIYVLNADEKLLVDSITYRGDSVFIELPFFASGFAARFRPDGNLEGSYLKRYGDKTQVIPFVAYAGNKERFLPGPAPTANVNGKWAVTFPGKDELATRAVGDFHQSVDGRVTGTFLTATGDFRFLEGRVNGDSLRLSTFDGGHAMLFVARISGDSIARATLYSGLTASIAWSGVRDASASLPDSYSLTRLKAGETQLHFRFPATSGENIGISDERFKNKVVVVQILGSWCPNCMDETSFLSDFYRSNKAKGVEIVGLAYERTTDFAASKKALLPFQRRFKVDYPFLVTGVAVTDSNRTEKTLPEIEEIKAFPTTIFIGRDGKVKKIHTGLNGPGTGSYYEEFKKEFNEEIALLLAERE